MLPCNCIWTAPCRSVNATGQTVLSPSHMALRALTFREKIGLIQIALAITTLEPFADLLTDSCKRWKCRDPRDSRISWHA